MVDPVELGFHKALFLGGWLTVDAIEEFIGRYAKEYDYYVQVGHIAAREIEVRLQESGIRSIVNSRAKSVSRLRDKCKQRQQSGKTYESTEDLFEDIVDLAGVRIALYFPAEREQVDGIIERLFHVNEKKKFPAPEKTFPEKRFSGYSAMHYRVQLDSQKLGDLDQRYTHARIEIQVASILMHAWSEVEHDLIYKPLAGKLSDEEYAILDQLNGLVLSGEIALEMLQSAAELRVTEKDMHFGNHYELAAHLVRLAGDKLRRSVNDAGLGRVDQLFTFLGRLDLNSADGLAPYMDALHGDFELRPLAEQIIDLLLEEDSSRYEVYKDIKGNLGSPTLQFKGEDAHRLRMGQFITNWVLLERLIFAIAKKRGVSTVPARPLHSLLNDLGTVSGIVSESTMREIVQLRRLRNTLVHGMEPIDSATLEDASKRVEEIADEIQRQDQRMDR